MIQVSYLHSLNGYDQICGWQIYILYWISKFHELLTWWPSISTYDFSDSQFSVVFLYVSHQRGENVRIRFTSANPYIIYTYLEFPLGLYAYTKLVLRLGIDGVVTSTAQATSPKHKNLSSPIFRNSAAISIKYLTLYFSIHIGSITHTSPIYPRSLHFAAHITGLVRLIYQYDVFDFAAEILMTVSWYINIRVGSAACGELTSILY